MPYRHLLVPSDGSELSLRAVGHAVDLAAALSARMTVMHVQPYVPTPVIGMGEMLDATTMEMLIRASDVDSQRILDEAQARAEASQVACDREQVMGDVPHIAILETAERLGCDLIVMASHGRRGLSGLLLGSETHRVLVQSPVPVLVIR